MLQLSPAPGEQDFLYHLGDREGIRDLYDLQDNIATSSTKQQHTPH